jgi:hypothetical protein
MPRHHDLHRRVGAHGQTQGVGVGLLALAAVGADLDGRRKRQAFDRPGQLGHDGFERTPLTLQPLEIAAAGADPRPVDGALDEGRTALGEGVEDGAVVGSDLHGRGLA